MDETLIYELKSDVQMSKNAEEHIADYSSQINYWSTHNYSWNKKPIDLSIHSRSECQKTIFEDAEYFAENYSYKLMPITFEVVNETIIHIEHNYCYPVPKTDNENKDNRATGNFLTEIGERNYKKRKSKIFSEENDIKSVSDSERLDKEKLILKDFVPRADYEEFVPNAQVDEENFNSVQPLDLSLPFLQEQKSDALRENHSIVGSKIKSEIRNSVDVQQLKINESNKENVKNNAREIEVTISRPGQKEYYQPCDIFLNDVARISKDLIKNDCYEIEIIDRTHSQDFRSIKARTYYIVSQSTWRAFKNSTERIILTNDLNIGQPVQNNEKLTKPTYLIFDQNSLTESLARICEKKGGSFEYTCLEESKEPVTKIQENRKESQGRDYDNASAKKTINEPENYSVSDENRICNNYTFEDRLEEKEKVKVDREAFKIANSIETSILQNLLISEHKPQARNTRFNLTEMKCHNSSDAGKLFAETVSRGSEKTELFEKVNSGTDSQLRMQETEAKASGDNPARTVFDSTFPDQQKLFKPITNSGNQSLLRNERERLQISNTVMLTIESTKTDGIDEISMNDSQANQLISTKKFNEMESGTDRDLQEHEKFVGEGISSKIEGDLTVTENDSHINLSKVAVKSVRNMKERSTSKNRQDVVSDYGLRKRRKSSQTQSHNVPKELKLNSKGVKEVVADKVVKQDTPSPSKANKSITETPSGRKTRSSSSPALSAEKNDSSAVKMNVEKLKNEEEHDKSDNRRRIIKKRESKSAALIKICSYSRKSEGNESKTPLIPRKRTSTGGKLELRNIETGLSSSKKRKTPIVAASPDHSPNSETKLTPNTEMAPTGYALRSGNRNKTDCVSTKLRQVDMSDTVGGKNCNVGRIELKSSKVGKNKDTGRNLRRRCNDTKTLNLKKTSSAGSSAKDSNGKRKRKEILILKKKKGKKQ